MSLHLVPANDTTTHTPAYHCPCGPRREAVEHEGSIRWAVVHRPVIGEAGEMSALPDRVTATSE